jgi:hypothetical protein
LTFRNQSHPACACIFAIHDSYDSYIRGSAPAFDEDPYSRVLKYLDRTQRGRRRVPERDV